MLCMSGCTRHLCDRAPCRLCVLLHLKHPEVLILPLFWCLGDWKNAYRAPFAFMERDRWRFPAQLQLDNQKVCSALSGLFEGDHVEWPTDFDQSFVTVTRDVFG